MTPTIRIYKADVSDPSDGTKAHYPRLRCVSEDHADRAAREAFLGPLASVDQLAGLNVAVELTNL